MFKRIIAKLYNRYCKIELKTLFLSGIQRDFTHELNEREQRLRDAGCVQFVNSLACDVVFNEILKEHNEALYTMGETEEMRNQLYSNINVVLKVEEKIRSYTQADEETEVTDPYNPL